MAQQFDIIKPEVGTKALQAFQIVGQQNARLKAAQQAQERLAMQSLGMELRDKALELKQDQMLGNQIIGFQKLDIAKQAAALKRMEDALDLTKAGLELENLTTQAQRELTFTQIMATTPEGVPDGRPLIQRMGSNNKEERDKAWDEYLGKAAELGPLEGTPAKQIDALSRLRQQYEVGDRARTGGATGAAKAPAPATINTIATLEGNIAETDAALKGAVQAGDDKAIRELLAKKKGLLKHKEVLQGSDPFNTPPQQQSTIIGNQTATPPAATPAPVKKAPVKFIMDLDFNDMPVKADPLDDQNLIPNR